MKRSFTVKADKQEVIELLTISHRELQQMKTAFSEAFSKMIQDAICELQKTITVKLYAMDLCNYRWSQYANKGLEVPNYDVKIISNEKIKKMTHEEVSQFT